MNKATTVQEVIERIDLLIQFQRENLEEMKKRRFPDGKRDEFLDPIQNRVDSILMVRRMILGESLVTTENAPQKPVKSVQGTSQEDKPEQPERIMQ